MRRFPVWFGALAFGWMAVVILNTGTSPLTMDDYLMLANTTPEMPVASRMQYGVVFGLLAPALPHTPWLVRVLNLVMLAIYLVLGRRLLSGFFPEGVAANAAWVFLLTRSLHADAVEGMRGLAIIPGAIGFLMLAVDLVEHRRPRLPGILGATVAVAQGVPLWLIGLALLASVRGFHPALWLAAPGLTGLSLVTWWNPDWTQAMGGREVLAWDRLVILVKSCFDFLSIRQFVVSALSLPETPGQWVYAAGFLVIGLTLLRRVVSATLLIGIGLFVTSTIAMWNWGDAQSAAFALLPAVGLALITGVCAQALTAPGSTGPVTVGGKAAVMGLLLVLMMNQTLRVDGMHNEIGRLAAENFDDIRRAIHPPPGGFPEGSLILVTGYSDFVYSGEFHRAFAYVSGRKDVRLYQVNSSNPEILMLAPAAGFDRLFVYSVKDDHLGPDEDLRRRLADRSEARRLMHVLRSMDQDQPAGAP